MSGEAIKKCLFLYFGLYSWITFPEMTSFDINVDNNDIIRLTVKMERDMEIIR